ncbi:MAG: O-antigen ligase family protein [Roseimicrobium sp.]
MAFISVIILLLFYFIRPQDWVPGMAGFNIIKPVIALGVMGLMSRPTNEPRWRFASTPQEWALLIFAGYVVLTAQQPTAALTDVGVLVVFSLLVLHSLTTEVALTKYLGWWTAALVGVLGMAMATRIGIDITDARGHIAAMGGRFLLNTWTLNNPNAFGHTLITLLPLSYYFLFYKRPFVSRLIALVVMVLTVVAIIPTASKGSFIAGSVALLASVLFGRKIIFQILALMAAFAVGGSILAMLPRMEDMKNLRSNEGVQGRLLAWEAARTVTRQKSTGDGYKSFVALIRWEGKLEEKATHSAFVKVGGDLGTVGLTIYIGMLLVCLRTLMQYPGLTEDMERCRRALFSLLAAFSLSGWMIDRSYHTELFFLLGAVGVYQNLSIRMRTAPIPEERKAKLGWEDEPEEAIESMSPAPVPVGGSYMGALGMPQLAMAGAGAGSTYVVESSPGNRLSEFADDARTDIEVATTDEVADEWGHAPAPKPKKLWHRLGLLDVLLAIAGGQATLWFWDHLMKTI